MKNRKTWDFDQLAQCTKSIAIYERAMTIHIRSNKEKNQRADTKKISKED